MVPRGKCNFFSEHFISNELSIVDIHDSFKASQIEMYYSARNCFCQSLAYRRMNQSFNKKPAKKLSLRILPLLFEIRIFFLGCHIPLHPNVVKARLKTIIESTDGLTLELPNLYSRFSFFTASLAVQKIKELISLLMDSKWQRI